jgi:hypothetical protein
MKETRKQKLRKKEEKRRKSEDRKYAVLDRLVHLHGLKGVFCPLDWTTKAGAAVAMNPGLEVEIADDSKDDAELEEIKALFEKAAQTPVAFPIEDRIAEVSLDDLCRGLHAVPMLVNVIHKCATTRKIAPPPDLLARLEQARKLLEKFDDKLRGDVLVKLARQLDSITDEYLRIDERIIWYRVERNEKYPDRSAIRVIVGRSRQMPVSLPVADGRRRAYPCIRCTSTRGHQRQVTWNPQKLGIGPDDRDLPVFVGEHTISRLHERMSLYGESGILHRMMYDCLDKPRLKPTEGADGFLVEAGRQDAKLGYFVVEVYADFVFVKTFLFLTMQGTPEARCLRQKLGLSRKDIEFFKLDNFYTLACSDLGEDPELRRALAECGCDYLLDFSDPEQRLSWLKRYRDRFRQELGLAAGPANGVYQAANSTERNEIEEMIAYSRDALKYSQGWTL